MSDATKQAIHDAIAAHMADENASEGTVEYLTEWVVVASAAIANDPDCTSYWFLNSPGVAYHHKLGLLHRGLEYLTNEE